MLLLKQKKIKLPKETSKAVKYNEFERITVEDIQARMDGFQSELQEDPSAQAYIINYGSDREVARRERVIRNTISFRRFDTSRITFVYAGFRNIVKTELWFVAAGAESPILLPTAVKADQFGKVSEKNLEIKI